MDKKTPLIIVSVILIAVCSFVFYQAGKSAGQDKLVEQAKQIETLQKGLETFFPALPEYITGTTGEITKIEQGAFYFKAPFRVKRFPQTDGSENQDLIKKVNIAAETKIVKSDFEMPPSEEMSGVNEISLSLSDLQVGQYVHVSTEENMIKKDEFTATSVQLFETF